MRSGFISILGPTNSGKSTLLNALVGKKISIVSSRSQTTYHSIRGIKTSQVAQLVITDTPGYQSMKGLIPRSLVEIADQSGKQSDLVIWVFDIASPVWRKRLQELLPKIRSFKGNRKPICVLNKVDKVRKEELLPILKELSEMNLFSEVVPLSAKRKSNVDRLERILEEASPEGELHYPSDVLTDRNERFLVTERVREKIYEFTREEVPYASRIEVEEWTSNKKGVEIVEVSIFVDSDSRKAILIGSGGSRLKEIGTAARMELEELLGKRFCLKLFVKVDPDWKNDTRGVRRYLELDS